MERDTCNAALVRLSTVAERVANAVTADEGLHAVVQAVKDLFDVQTVAVLLLDEQAQNFHIRAFRGLSGSFVAQFSRPVTHGIVAEVAIGGMALLLPDPGIDRDAYRDFRLENEFGSAMAVQMTINHKPVGYLYCDHAAVARFERTDLQVLRCVAILASLAIEKSSLHQRLDELAVTDGVTGLYTSSHFYSRLAQDLARAKRYGESLALLTFQVEHLERLEETYGRPAADEAMRHIADLIREHTRGVDYAGRHADDEIIVCLVRSDASALKRVSDRVAAMTGEGGSGITVPAAGRKGAAKGAKPLKVSVFVAGAAVAEAGETVAQLSARLADALAEARERGAGRLVVAS